MKLFENLLCNRLAWCRQWQRVNISSRQPPCHLSGVSIT